ncbi:hypothetical protein V1478_004324, partial [Vespula squamosa]
MSTLARTHRQHTRSYVPVYGNEAVKESVKIGLTNFTSAQRSDQLKLTRLIWRPLSIHIVMARMCDGREAECIAYMHSKKKLKLGY